MKKTLIIIAVVVVIVGGIIGWRVLSARADQRALMENLQTVPAEKGTLVATIGATGQVRSNQSALLTWQTSGTVESVLARVGDQVEAGQILAALVQTSLPQNVILAQADLVSAEKALDDLLSSGLQRAQAMQAVKNAEQALEDLLDPELQQALALQAVADAEQAVSVTERLWNNAKSTASQADIDSASSQVVLLRDDLKKAKEAFAPYEDKPEDNLTRAALQSRLSEAQQRYDAAVRNLNALEGTGSETDIAVAAANYAAAQAQLSSAERAYERVKDGPSEADVALLQAQLADAQRAWERVQDGTPEDDIAAAEARVAAAQATLDQAVIKAPFGGTVTMADSKHGDQINPGTLSFRVDDFSRLLVDLEVSEVDINTIEIGQAVTMSFDAILAKAYHGTVSEVGMVGNEVQGVVSFRVTVELEDADEEVRPGMTSAVNIVIYNLDETLIVPNRAVRVVDGERVVYVKKGDAVEKVVIVLGASSDTHSEIVEGELEVGDEIIINPPSELMETNGFGPPSGVRNSGMHP
ncbi:MAG: efflux RND transporter periplasmic adaptor subunit [Chloroflexota bacterium]